MKLKVLIIDDNDKQFYTDFYVNKKEIHGGYVVTDLESDGSKCVNILLPSGVFSVRADKNITDYLFKKLL